MGFSKGQTVKESAPVKRYMGIAPVSILALNPNRVELEKIYNTTIDNDPIYVGESDITVAGVDKKVPMIRLDFLVKTDPESTATPGIDMTTKITLFLNKENRFNNDGSKVQVIDKYGRTAWATPDELENKTIPMYSNGPASIDKDFRAAFIGEEALIDFIKQYLGIGNPQAYKNGKWVDKSAEEMENAKAFIEISDFNKLFTGDVSKLREFIGYQPNNKIKAVFGVKTTDENTIYQDVYNRKFMKGNSSYVDTIKREITQGQENGAFPNTEFSFGPLKEYNVDATDFNQVPTATANPFANVENTDTKNPFN